MPEPTDTPTLDQLLDDINKLKQGQLLLNAVWVHLGPYFHCGPGFPKLPNNIITDIQRYFEFDDSE